ncbi:MAG: hypothetical protein J6Y08_09320 [Clostridiales bacterium]|nr:hypothetical protein [Clostridiales bacterium]
MKKSWIALILTALLLCGGCKSTATSSREKKKKDPSEKKPHDLFAFAAVKDPRILYANTDFLEFRDPEQEYFDFLPSSDEKLIDHITCPSDNMFGLKEIYIYDYTCIAIFDKEAFNAPVLYNFDAPPEWAHWSWEYEDVADHIAYEKWYYSAGIATAVDGEDRIYISKYTRSFKDQGSDKQVDCMGRSITISDDGLFLFYEEEWTADITYEHRQTYDVSTGKWGEEEVTYWTWND